MKTYRNHNCDRGHRTYGAMIACAVPRAAWVCGGGPFALIAWCSVPTVTLHRELAAAQDSLRAISSGCGSRCKGRHEVVRVQLPSIDQDEHYLYRLFDRQGVLLYVGISHDWVARFSQHRQSKPWWSHVARHTIEVFEDRPSALVAEAVAIASERPLHNIVQPRLAP